MFLAWLGPGLAAAASVIAALATLFLSLLLGRAAGLGLVGMACVVAGLGFFLVARDVIRRRSVRRLPDFHRAAAPVHPDVYPDDLRLGLGILGGFVGAAFIAAVDAGLKLLGA
jgi:hypothetical protein